MTYAPGGGLGIDVGYTVAALVAFATLLAPGFGIALGLGRRAGWDLPAVIAAAFALQMAVVGGVSLFAHYAGQSLTFVLVTSAVALAVLLAVGVRLGRGESRPRAGWGGLGLGLVAAAAAVVERPWYGQADTFYHLAAIRSLLATGRPVVTDPFYHTAITVLDPTSGVWHTELAIIARATGLDPMWLWPGAVAVGAAMTVMAFWALCRAVGGSRGASTVATAAFLVFGLAFDMRWFGYPNRMSLALVLLALAGISALMDEPKSADAVLVVVAAFSAISLHLAAAAVSVIAGGFLGLLLLAEVLVARARGEEASFTPMRWLLATGAALVLASVAVLLPKAGVVAGSSLLFSTSYGAGSLTWALPLGLKVASPLMLGAAGTGVAVFATVLAAFAAAPAFRGGDRRALAAFGLAMLPVAVLLDPPVTTLMLALSPYMTLRIAMMMPFTVFVAMAWALSRPPAEGRRIAAAAVAAVIALVLVGAGSLGTLHDTFVQSQHSVISVPVSRTRDIRTSWGPDVVASMARVFGDRYPIVAGDTETSYYLCGVLPAAVVAVPVAHSPFAIEKVDGAQRRADIKSLMQPDMSEARRRSILLRWNADYVIVPRSGAYAATLASMRAEADLLKPVVDSRTLVLFEVLR